MSMLIIRCLHRRPAFCAKSIVNNVLRRCSQSSQKIQLENDKPVNDPTKSQLFPDYKVVYHCPAIRYISLFSLTKRFSTICVTASTGAVAMALAANMITGETATAIAFPLLMFWMHSTGYLLLNNVVGLIYYKENEGKVIVSYVNSWGRRINQELSVMDIVSLSDTNPNLLKFLYRKLYILSPKVTLKIYFGRKIFLQEEDLGSIIGTWK